tara:strand:+ start:59 stop:976 length:918 start_codon:yes stop_codon:yes gene_type:complete
MKILITGITGFLGSQLAEYLLSQGNLVIGTKRNSSSLERCKTFSENITWVNLEDQNWKQIIINYKPEVFVHAAWSGVGSIDRNNWHVQLKNIDFTLTLLEIANEVKVEKFIGLGSQAEYGLFSGNIDENQPIKPVSAYGSAKHLTAQLIQSYCEQNTINWYWLRLFSFFGEKEADNWFIPTLIKNIYNNNKMEMTPGMQKYAYMYVKDLSIIIGRIINSSIKKDIYNVSSKSAFKLKTIVEKIINITGSTNSKINFGALPYRENQPMLVKGDTNKLSKELGEIVETNFDENLLKVVQYINNQQNK